MKKSFVYRTLQIVSAVAVYSVTSIWASTAHVDAVSEIFTSINSLLVILAIAVALPYFCFKALGKLYTPPAARNLDNLSDLDDVVLSQEELKAIALKKKLEIMKYRGNHYEAEQLASNDGKGDINIKKTKPVIRYRGVDMDNDAVNSSTEEIGSFSAERNTQKSAKPKERMKYRGSYLD